YSIQMNYLEVMVELPWNDLTSDNFDLSSARTILDEDHFGLDKIKERIIEFIAVLKLKGDLKSPILCFVGPPGVGKTSLGKSIARALDRKYVRISLGGLRDEAEIRGHRKTYIGAMPGRIIQNIRKAKSANPVFVLDEIDKILGMNINGDPAAALLEVLDPEQNNAFYDNFIETGFDLSKVMFIATANTLSTIHPALRDRMEVIELNGYTIEEKLEIAVRHLIPKQLSEHGIKKSQVNIEKQIIQEIAENYTREAGVRALEKTLAKVIRNRAKFIANEEKYSAKIQSSELKEILGLPLFRHDKLTDNKVAGVVTGLAWTPFGGDILFIEVSLSKGKGILTLTGNLGDVMKESATIALEYFKSHCSTFSISPDVFQNWNVHIHIPEGATPKDGPSAGITMFTAIASAFTQRKVKEQIAMTGEITLRGKILPVGGIQEKILAARNAGINNIFLPIDNERDIMEIKPDYIKGMKFHYLTNMFEINTLLLLDTKVDNPILIEG
ncbi:MAG: endopeptidase La, partial [Bacteroidota bacterium]